MPTFRSSPNLSPSQPRLTRVHDILRRSAISVRATIAEVLVGGRVEPVFNIGGGFFVASFAGLDRYRKLNPEWFGYDAHHILEEQHSKLFPRLEATWARNDMPSVLLPKPVHAAIAGDLKEQLRARHHHSTQDVLSAYARVYSHVSHGHALTRIVQTMLQS